ncbi:MAG: proton-conducting transporter membrane subunit [Verrucomicrobiales bacterium]
MNILVLPILLPLLTAGAMLIMTGRHPRRQALVNVGGSAALFVAAVFLFIEINANGPQALAMGGWSAPFGIALAADMLSAVMVLIASMAGLMVAIYSKASVDPERVRFGYHPLFQFLLMGVCGAFLTSDLFNLFVWFEVMLMASFVLLALGGDKGQIQGALKYLTLNFLSSAVFLIGVALLYGQFGTLNMADMHLILQDPDVFSQALPAGMLLFVSFAIKAGLFPLFAWLPESYHTPPPAVTAIFAGLLSKVGVYALFRVFTLLFPLEGTFVQSWLLVISIITMVTGVLGAAGLFDFRKILAFHIISQIGYMTLGLALFTEAAIAAGIFYLVHNIVAKMNLFLVSGAVERLQGTSDLARLGGLYRRLPALSILFLLSALALAGIPPLSGFFAKFLLVKAALEEGAFVSVFFALAVGMLTLFSMIKIWAESFLKAAPENNPLPTGKLKLPVLMWVPIVIMTSLAVLMGLLVGPIWEIMQVAAQQLLNPEAYVQAILQ